MNDHVTPVAFYFQVSIVDDANATEAVFQEVSGLQITLDTASIVEGDENRVEHRLPVKPRYDNLILKRGLLPLNSMLVKWCRDTLEAGMGTQVKTRDLTVSLIDQEGLSVAQWMFANAYPVKWQVASMRADEEKLVIEAIEFVYTTATRIQ